MQHPTLLQSAWAPPDATQLKAHQAPRFPFTNIHSECWQSPISETS